MLEINNIFNDFENSKDSKPQIMMKIKDLENSIIIVEIDSFDDEEIPFDATDRITYHSNAIEGSTFTYAETYAILYNDNSFKIVEKEPREIYEAINHKKALELVFRNLQNNEEFDERFIKK